MFKRKRKRYFVVLTTVDSIFAVKAVCTSAETAAALCERSADHYIEVKLNEEIPDDVQPVYP
jgi:hypothetical protein